MAQLLISPGAEVPSAEIDLAGPATRTTATPRSGSFAYEVRKTGTGPTQLGSITWRTVPLLPGMDYTVEGYHRVVSYVGGQLIAEVDRGDGTFVTLATIANVLGPPAYQLWEIGTFQALGHRGRFRLRALAGTTGNATWRVDDLSVVGPMVSGWAAHQALYTALAGITGAGAGYYHDLDGRVFYTLVDPGDAAAPRTLPYLCLPLFDEEETPTIYQRGLLESPWTVRIYAFVKETSLAPLMTGTVEGVYKLKEDIKKALLKDTTLNRTVSDLTIARITSIAGADPEMKHGEILFELRLKQEAQESDLGISV